jgi:hypothetical protein
MAARPPPEQPDDSASPASALTVGGPASPLTLLLAEHSRWWREGKPSRVEEMLARHPSLADDPEVLLQLADHKVESPEDVVKVGDEIEVRVLRVDAADRKIGLSRKRLSWTKTFPGCAARPWAAGCNRFAVNNGRKQSPRREKTECAAPPPAATPLTPGSH